MDKASTGHRLDRRADRYWTVAQLHAARKADEAIAVGRGGADLDMVSSAVNQGSSRVAYDSDPIRRATCELGLLGRL